MNSYIGHPPSQRHWPTIHHQICVLSLHVRTDCVTKPFRFQFPAIMYLYSLHTHVTCSCDTTERVQPHTSRSASFFALSLLLACIHPHHRESSLDLRSLTTTRIHHPLHQLKALPPNRLPCISHAHIYTHIHIHTADHNARHRVVTTPSLLLIHAFIHTRHIHDHDDVPSASAMNDNVACLPTNELKLSRWIFEHHSLHTHTHARTYIHTTVSCAELPLKTLYICTLHHKHDDIILILISRHDVQVRHISMTRSDVLTLQLLKLRVDIKPV